VMMLACPELRVVPVTIHMSLSNAIAALNTETIVRTATIAEDKAIANNEWKLVFIRNSAE